jgi:hypothetical protein
MPCVFYFLAAGFPLEGTTVLLVLDRSNTIKRHYLCTRLRVQYQEIGIMTAEGEKEDRDDNNNNNLHPLRLT